MSQPRKRDQPPERHVAVAADPKDGEARKGLGDHRRQEARPGRAVERMACAPKLSHVRIRFRGTGRPGEMP